MAPRIQFLGLVGSGKSYLARALAKRVGGRVVSFADGVYRLAEIAKGAPVDKTLPQDRELLKMVGTTWGREMRALPDELQTRLEQHKPDEWGSPDVWARIFVRNCLEVDCGTPIINDDTRFINELEISQATLGFIPVFVKCDERTRLARLTARGDRSDANDPLHVSEFLSNLLDRVVLSRELLPVVWNDQTVAPSASWVYSVAAFTDILVTCHSTHELARKLGWNAGRASHLLSYLHEAQGRYHAQSTLAGGRH